MAHDLNSIANLESAITEYVRFHDDQIVPRLPAPPAEWKDLENDFARIAADLRPIPMPKRGRQKFWGAAALTAMVAAAGVTYLFEVRREAPRVVVEAPRKVATNSPSVLRAPAPPVTPPALPNRNLEVRILAALHRAGADLGDPVDVEFQGGHWRVKVIESSPGRTKALREALAPLSGVELVLNADPPEIHALDDPSISTRDAKSPSAILAFGPQLEQYFGSRAGLSSAADRAFDRSQAILARAHALQRLDQEFPAPTEMALGPDERTVLRTIRMDHYQAVASARSGLGLDFGSLAAALGIEAGQNGSGSKGILAAAARWDHALAVILGGAATSLTQDQLKTELAAAFADLDKILRDLP